MFLVELLLSFYEVESDSALDVLWEVSSKSKEQGSSAVLITSSLKAWDGPTSILPHHKWLLHLKQLGPKEEEICCERSLMWKGWAEEMAFRIISSIWASETTTMSSREGGDGEQDVDEV